MILSRFLKSIMALFGLMFAANLFAQIPQVTKSATSEFSGVSSIASLQIISLGILDSNSPKGRLNVWNGVKPDAVVGNYTSDLYKSASSNEIWVAQIISDGRFTLRTGSRLDMCLTAEKTLSSAFEAEFGESVRAVKVKKCSSDTFGQQLFLQKSTLAKNSPFVASASYVIRLVDEPTVCLSTFINSAKGSHLSPVTTEACSQSGSGGGTDRWVITSTQAKDRASSDRTLAQMANVWAMQNYVDAKGISIYNKSLAADVRQATLMIDPAIKYKRLYFDSPFSGQSVSAYVNATPEQQELHIERFDISGFDKSIEIGGGTLSKLTGIGLVADIKGKLDFKKSTQDNVKLWQKVPPYTTMFFVAGTTKVSGGYTLSVVTDLGDKWETSEGNFSQDVLSILAACTDTSTSQICAQARE